MIRISGLVLSVILAFALAQPLAAGETATRVDLNKASVEELVKLPKIGPAVAQRIVEYRKQNGAFRKVEELMQVRGVGPKTFEVLKAQITVGDSPREGSERDAATAPRPASAR